MDTTDSDDEARPIPLKRTRAQAEPRLTSPKKFSPSRAISEQQHPRSRKEYRRVITPNTEEDRVRSEDGYKPKPKPRTVPGPVALPSTSTSTAPTIKHEKSKLVQKSKSTKKIQSPPSSEEPAFVVDTPSGGDTGIEQVPDTESGLRIRDILQAFQDDVVTVKSPQRGKWQDKLDQILFPELNRPQFSETVTGWDRRASVLSKWKSAASLVPRDTVEFSRKRNTQSIFYVFSKCLKRVSFYFSGVLCGLLVWKGLFAVAQMLASEIFHISPFFWSLFWTVTTLFMLITTLGFLNSQPKDSVLRLMSCLVIVTPYYLSKAFDLQRSECYKFLEVNSLQQKRHHIHSTYSCDLSVAGKTWNDFNYWTISLELIPAIGTLVLHTYLHCAVQSPSLNSDSTSTLVTSL